MVSKTRNLILGLVLVLAGCSGEESPAGREESRQPLDRVEAKRKVGKHAQEDGVNLANRTMVVDEHGVRWKQEKKRIELRLRMYREGQLSLPGASRSFDFEGVEKGMQLLEGREFMPVLLIPADLRGTEGTLWYFLDKYSGETIASFSL